MSEQLDVAADVIIYHNPACGTSRNTLALIRNAGVEPHIIEYLKTPPTRVMLASLIERMGVSVRSVLREKERTYAELGLADEALSDDALLDAMIEHPILINRPIVACPRGVRLCRPSEAVLDLLPPQLRKFAKEDGEAYVRFHPKADLTFSRSLSAHGLGPPQRVRSVILAYAVSSSAFLLIVVSASCRLAKSRPVLSA